jgi:hypothetical protein
VLHPAAHEAQPPPEVVPGNIRGSAGKRRPDALPEVRLEGLVGIEAQHPIVVNRHVLQRPVELLRLIFEAMLVDPGPGGRREPAGGVIAVRVHHNDLVHLAFSAFEQMREVDLFVKGQHDEGNWRRP